MNDIQKKLLAAARQAAEKAYAPYSGFRVGAAVLRGGEMYTGANVENASSNLGICAERTALAFAKVHGTGHIEGIAVCCPDVKTDAGPDESGGLDPACCMPCGGCRQWIAELAPDAWVVTSASGAVYYPKDLLPSPFVLR